MEACCPGNAAPLEPLHEHFDDPALADCCRRDLKEQAATAKIIKRLNDCDISASRQRLEAAVIRRQPWDNFSHDSEIDSLATDSDDEGDCFSASVDLS